METYDYEFAQSVGKQLAKMTVAEARSWQTPGMDIVHCIECHTPVRKHQYSIVNEEWEAQPTFYHRDTNEVIHYCPTCGAFLAEKTQ